MFISTAAVSMKTALKYRRGWDKQNPTVKLLQSLMPRGSTGYRLYVPIGTSNKRHLTVPITVRQALRKAGFRVTDYRAKKCVKITDKEQKNEYNIGKVLAKDSVAKTAFDNDPQLQNSSAKFTLVVSCHPYDIIGMSTGRNWDQQSCMRLADGRDGKRDGIESGSLRHDVAAGTLVAYAIRSSDENIQNPECRCLLKPFINVEDESIIMYRQETTTYGNPVPGFNIALNKVVRQLNKDIPQGGYALAAQVYDDGVGGYHTESNHKHVDTSNVFDLIRKSPEEIVDILRSAKSNVDESEFVAAVANAMEHEQGKEQARQIAALIAEPKYVIELLEGDQDSLLEYFMRFPRVQKVVKEVENGRASNRLKSFYDKHAVGRMMRAQRLRQRIGGAAGADMQVTSLVVQALGGRVRLRAKDFEEWPRLNNIAYTLSTFVREASKYGVYKELLHQAEIIYGQIQEGTLVDLNLGLDELPPEALYCYYKQYGDFSKIMYSTQWQHEVLRNPKLRREILGKNCPESLLQYRQSMVGGYIETQELTENLSAKRDVDAYIKANGILVANRMYHYTSYHFGIADVGIKDFNIDNKHDCAALNRRAKVALNEEIKGPGRFPEFDWVCTALHYMGRPTPEFEMQDVSKFLKLDGKSSHYKADLLVAGGFITANNILDFTAPVILQLGYKKTLSILREQPPIAAAYAWASLLAKISDYPSGILETNIGIQEDFTLSSAEHTTKYDEAILKYATDWVESDMPFPPATGDREYMEQLFGKIADSDYDSVGLTVEAVLNGARQTLLEHNDSLVILLFFIEEREISKPESKERAVQLIEQMRKQTLKYS